MHNFFDEIAQVTKAQLASDSTFVGAVHACANRFTAIDKFIASYRRLCWPEMPTSYGGKDVWKCLQDMSGSMRTNRDDEDYVDKCEAAIYELATGMMVE